MPWYLVAVLACVYALYFHDAYELLMLAVAIDAYFGALTIVPYYTLACTCILLAAAWAKPRLLIYNEGY